MDFVGRTMEQVLGNGWAEGVHKDDSDRCLNIYTAAFDAREHFSMIYRLRRRDGAYRQILDNGVPFYRSGEFAGDLAVASTLPNSKRRRLKFAKRKKWTQSENLQVASRMTSTICCRSSAVTCNCCRKKLLATNVRNPV